MLNVSVRPQPAAVAAVSALAATAGKTSSDELLVEQIAAGSKPASYARSLTRSEIDAEDLVHDALVRAYEKRASFRAGHNMRVWLMSIMHNVFIDGTRARRA